MPKLKFHGATLDEKVIAEFYPQNSDFGYFLFHHEKDPSGNYYLKVYAHKKNGERIKEVNVSKDKPAISIDFTEWKPADIKIGTTHQLDKLNISPGEKIKSLKLSSKKYKDNYVCQNVQIQSGFLESNFDKDINPSPPASHEDNEW
jgi:hypothetical protein